MRIFFCMVAAMLAAPATADGDYPKDVKAFIAAADQCEHFAGEWDSGLAAKEQRRIEKQVTMYCGQANRQMLALKKKYRGNTEVDRILSGYESVSSYAD